MEEGPFDEGVRHERRPAGSRRLLGVAARGAARRSSCSGRRVAGRIGRPVCGPTRRHQLSDLSPHRPRRAGRRGQPRLRRGQQRLRRGARGHLPGQRLPQLPRLPLDPAPPVRGDRRAGRPRHAGRRRPERRLRREPVRAHGRGVAVLRGWERGVRLRRPDAPPARPQAVRCRAQRSRGRRRPGPHRGLRPREGRGRPRSAVGAARVGLPGRRPRRAPRARRKLGRGAQRSRPRRRERLGPGLLRLRGALDAEASARHERSLAGAGRAARRHRIGRPRRQPARRRGG